MVRELLNHFKQADGPDQEFYHVSCQPPLSEAQLREETIDDELINQKDCSEGADEDSGLQLHNLEQVQAAYEESYE